MIVDLQLQAFAGAAGRGMERSTAGNGGALCHCQAAKCCKAAAHQPPCPPVPPILFIMMLV
eukprot:365366-Chlamydomonas_euryale.AAC.18